VQEGRYLDALRVVRRDYGNAVPLAAERLQQAQRQSRHQCSFTAVGQFPDIKHDNEGKNTPFERTLQKTSSDIQY
jgi:hypothetical protein